MEKHLLLSKLKYLIKKEFDYEIFRSIIQYCPLKYYIINFKKNTFIIKPLFPFMQNIINYKLKEIECDEYFIKERYKTDIIANNYVKGDYFEASAKFGIQRLKLPHFNKNKSEFKIITLNEIVSMDKIIYDDDFSEDYLGDNSSEESEEDKIEKETFYVKNNKIDTNNINNINIDLEEENNESPAEMDCVESDEQKEISEEEKEKEEEEEEEEEDEDQESEENEEETLEKLENNKGKIKEISNTKLDSLLDRFEITIKTKTFDEEGLSNEAIAYSKNIEDYRVDEIIKQNNQIQEFEKSNFKGDEKLFLDQFSKWGKALDFAYLYGSKNKKTFFGFQMKCYFENSVLSDNAVDKCWIRKNCQKILVNSMKLLNCKITKWYYYLVFFLNNKNKSENINTKNLEKCRKNNIRFIFYEPFEKKFYNYKQKKLCIIKELKLESKANLDAYVINEEKFYNLNLTGKIQLGKNMRHMQESFFEDFKKVFKNQNELDTVSLILRKIAVNIKMKNFWLSLVAKCEFNKNFICPPDKNYILLYKKKNSDDFIASFMKKGKSQFIEISTGNIVDDIFEVLDGKSEYYYWLLKWRIPKVGKSCSKLDKLNKNDIKMLNLL